MAPGRGGPTDEPPLSSVSIGGALIIGEFCANAALISATFKPISIAIIMTNTRTVTIG
jgi:hypothetical protein